MTGTAHKATLHVTGKAIANYIRDDREHLGVELRAACQAPKKVQSRMLREIAWAAVDNIEYAMEHGPVIATRGDISDAVKLLRQRCTRRSVRSRAPRRRK